MPRPSASRRMPRSALETPPAPPAAKPRRGSVPQTDTRRRLPRPMRPKNRGAASAAPQGARRSSSGGRPTSPLRSGVFLLWRRRLVPFVLRLVHRSTELSNRPSQRATDPPPPPGTEDDKRQEENDDQFRPSDTGHASPPASLIHPPCH